MSAKIRFLGVLKEFQPESDENGAWQVPAGKTVQEIVDECGIKSGIWEYYITVNGKSVLRESKLNDGDEMIFSTLFLGG
ncbi:MAG: hypothetical protein FWE66_03175 [Oscillospiraceae bacterium]|nr:hypothetical protein [Oscillospiraceae bacterium]